MPVVLKVIDLIQYQHDYLIVSTCENLTVNHTWKDIVIIIGAVYKVIFKLVIEL